MKSFAASVLLMAASGAGADTCKVNKQDWQVCATDRGGWAFEDQKYCIARSFCPASRSREPDLSTRSVPVDGKADATTKNVYNYLRSVWGSKVLAGQQDLTWNDAVDMAERVKSDTDRYPALMGYDFMNYGMKSGNGLRQTEEAIAWSKRGGLVTFAWHWRDPALLKTGQVKQAKFYAREPDQSKNTSFTIPVRGGALDASSAAYRQINDGIDLIATELKKLSDAGVPVLWRPLHEAAGHEGDGWFWWGRARRDGVPQAYANILLYRHMFDRLVRVHGLHNLIWVWNGQDAAWYPGDDVVDVISWDIYDDTDNKNYNAQLPTYTKARRISREAKPIALSENSYIPHPEKMASDGAWWSWFLTWNDGKAGTGISDPGNFWTGEYYNTNVHKRSVYKHPLVITLDELPRF